MLFPIVNYFCGTEVTQIFQSATSGFFKFNHSLKVQKKKIPNRRHELKEFHIKTKQYVGG